MKEELINKINNYNFNFTNNELILISDNLDLINLIINKLNNNITNISRDLYNTISLYINNFFSDPKRLNEYSILLTNIYTFFIESNILSQEEFLMIDKKYQDNIKDIYYKSLKNKKIIITPLYSFMLEAIYNNKDYKLLDKYDYFYDYDQYINKDKLNNMINDIIINLGYLPRCFNSYIKDNNIELDDKYKSIYYYTDYENIIKKIDDIGLEDDVIALHDFLNNLLIEDLKIQDIYLRLVKKGLITYLPYLDSNIINKNYNDIINVLDKDISFNIYVNLVSDYTFFDNIKNYPEIIKKILDKNIKEGLPLYLVNIDVFDDNFKQIMNLMKEYYNENKELFCKIIDQCDSTSVYLALKDEKFVYTERDILELYEIGDFDTIKDIIVNKKIKQVLSFSATLSSLLADICMEREDILDILVGDDFYKHLFNQVAPYNEYEDFKPTNKLVDLVYEKDNIFNIIKVNNYNYTNKKINFIDMKIYPKLREYFEEFYNFDIRKLDYLVYNLKEDILSRIKENEIKRLLALDLKELKRLVDLLNVDEYNRTDALALYDILKQYEFYIENPDIINIYSNILNGYYTEKDINNIIKYMDIFYKDKKIDDKREYLFNLISNIQDKNDLISLDEFHNLCNFYILKERENIIKQYNLELELLIPSYYYNIDLYDKVMKYWFRNNTRQKDIIKSICDFDIDFELVVKAFLKEEVEVDNDKKDKIREYIKSLVKTTREFCIDYPYEVKSTLNMMSIPEIEKIKLNYFYHDKSKDVFDLISLIDFDNIKNILNNDIEYKKLKKLYTKYKLHLIPRYFDQLLKNVDIDTSYDTIVDLITYFDIIDNKYISEFNKDKILPFLKQGEVIGNNQSSSKRLLFKDEYYIFRADQNPNSSGDPYNDRLNKAVQIIINYFKKDKSYIPPINKIYNINGKSVRAVLSNYTNPINLTLGERTDSCMRVGSVGSGLLEFISKDKRGVHLRFETIEGELISRVSGLRNGNTLFFNQLRNPIKNILDNSELEEVFVNVSNDIIIEAYLNNDTIDNVVVSPDFAMIDSKRKRIKLKDIEILKDVKDKIWFDLDQKKQGILVASSGCDIDVDKNEYKLYEAEIDEVKEDITKDKLANMINRVDIIKKLLRDRNYDYIKSKPLINDPNDIFIGYANWEWYVFIDKLGNVKSDIISNNSKVRKDYKKHLDIISDNYIGINDRNIKESDRNDRQL